VIEPDVGVCKPANARSNVVFPHPLGPTSDVILPAGKWQEMSSIAAAELPKRTRRLSH
jgi:hypothetical protein